MSGPVSVNKDLRLMACAEIRNYLRVDHSVRIVSVADFKRMGEIPGSLEVGHTHSEAGYGKKIEFELAGSRADATRDLEIWKHRRIVAAYTDSFGNQRVCGSPGYPLRLDYAEAGDSYRVTLSGEDKSADAFLE